MPRKEYKTITIKQEVFARFLKACKEAKRRDPDMDNSIFLEKLLEPHKKKKS